MRTYRKKRHQPSVDMTSMLDIVFIMLIFFIVTATYVNESGITLHKPPSIKPIASNNPTNLSFEIKENDTVFMNGHLTDYWAAEAAAKQAITENPKMQIGILIHEGANMRTLVRMHDILKLAGVPIFQRPIKTVGF